MSFDGIDDDNLANALETTRSMTPQLLSNPEADFQSSAADSDIITNGLEEHYDGTVNNGDLYASSSHGGSEIDNLDPSRPTNATNTTNTISSAHGKAAAQTTSTDSGGRSNFSCMASIVLEGKSVESVVKEVVQEVVKEVDEEKLRAGTISPPEYAKLTPEQIAVLSKEELVEKWILQEKFINKLKNKLEKVQKEVEEMRMSRENEERLKGQIAELQRKEQYHIMRLSSKEVELQDMGAQILELKNNSSGVGGLKHCLLDPAVNLLFERLKRDLDSARAKMEEAQNELSAWKFTPDRCAPCAGYCPTRQYLTLFGSVT